MDVFVLALVGGSVLVAVGAWLCIWSALLGGKDD